MSRLRRAEERPSAGFEAFVAESGDRLLRLAVMVASDVAAGEDLYQITLTRLAANWDRVDNPTAYCRRVLNNLAIDRHRSLSRRREVRLYGLPSVPDPRSADAMGAAEVRTALFAALDELTPDQRLVVAMRYLEDRSEAEVASLLGQPVGTVKSTASRGLARLRRHPAIASFFAAEAAS